MKIDITKEKNKYEAEVSKQTKRNNSEKNELRELGAQIHALRGEYRTKEQRYIPHKYELMHNMGMVAWFEQIEIEYEVKEIKNRKKKKKDVIVEVVSAT